MEGIKKIALIINALAFIITLGCYGFIGEKDGLFAQIFLGGIQLGIGLIFFIRWKKRGTTIKKNVLLYWSIVLIYGVLFQMEINNLHNKKNGELIFLEIIPMCIAAYSVLITYLNIKDKHKYTTTITHA